MPANQTINIEALLAQPGTDLLQWLTRGKALLGFGQLGQVARAVNSSPFYFCKLFKKATGINFTDYLSRIRIERAGHAIRARRPPARFSRCGARRTPAGAARSRSGTPWGTPHATRSCWSRSR